jgi:hypothetical protein
MMAHDLFSGRWRMNPECSQLKSAPETWIQVIDAHGDHLRVREEITRNGQVFVVQVTARLDGLDYQVIGSPGADVIAYERVDSHNISGTAKKNGEVSLTETINISPDGAVMTMNFSVVTKDGTIISGIAVFERIEN